MTKEMFLEEHERIVSERMDAWDEAHPDATSGERARAWQRFYDTTGDAAYSAMQDRFADMADHYRQMKKDRM